MSNYRLENRKSNQLFCSIMCETYISAHILLSLKYESSLDSLKHINILSFP